MRVGLLCALLSLCVLGSPSLHGDTVARVTNAAGVTQSGWTIAFSSPSLTLAGRQTGTATMTVTSPASAVPGAYTITVTVTDGTSAHTTSRAVTYTVLDTTAPSAPTSLTATSTKGQTKSVTLKWAASGDNVGVTGYLVQRDGVRIGLVTGLTFTDTTVKSNTFYTYSVAAYDAALNVSAFAFVKIKP